jgi:hypothetical protein
MIQLLYRIADHQRLGAPSPTAISIILAADFALPGNVFPFG